MGLTPQSRQADNSPSLVITEAAYDLVPHNPWWNNHIKCWLSINMKAAIDELLVTNYDIMTGYRTDHILTDKGQPWSDLSSLHMEGLAQDCSCISYCSMVTVWSRQCFLRQSLSKKSSCQQLYSPSKHWKLLKCQLSNYHLNHISKCSMHVTYVEDFDIWSRW